MAPTECPLCFKSFPRETVEHHAYTCNGPEDIQVTSIPNVVYDITAKNADGNDGAMRDYVYCASEVDIHPSGNSQDHIPGELSLYKIEQALHLQWQPVEPECFGDDFDDEDISDLTQSNVWQSIQQRDAQAYSLDMAVLELQSIRKNIPTIGFSNVVLQLMGGVTLPPLYFHGGYQDMKYFFEALGDYVELTKEPNDPHLYMLPRGRGQEPLNGAATFGQMYSMRNHAWNVIGKISQTVISSRKYSHRQPDGNESKTKIGPDDFDEFELVSNDVDGVSSTPVPTKQYYPPPKVRVEERLPITLETLASFQDADGRIVSPPTMKALIFANGLAPEARKLVWKYLLDYYPWTCSETECLELRKEKTEEYNVYKSQWQSITPTQAKRFRKFRDREHRIEKDVSRTDRQRPIYRDENGEALKRMHDVLLTYVFYNFDLAYVQGMSDILGPILEVMDDEVDAFWCFVGIMDRVENNFQKDQNGVHTLLGRLSRLLRYYDPELTAHFAANGCENMFFCFRWVIINMKREFDYDSLQKLWEVDWTRHESPQFCLFVYCAVLVEYRVEILSTAFGFDGILKFINDLAETMDVEKILARASQICHEVRNSSDAAGLTDLFEVPHRKESIGLMRRASVPE